MRKWWWVGYTLVGILLVAVVVVVSVYFPYGKETAVEKNLSSVALATIAVFGYLLNWAWRYRKSAKFWVTFTALLLAHSAVFVPLSFYVDHWPILVLGPISGVEIMVLAIAILYLMHKTLDWRALDILAARRR